MAALSSTSVLSSSSSSSSTSDLWTRMCNRPFSKRNDIFSRISNLLLQRMADYLGDRSLARWMKADRRIAILPDPLQMAVEDEQLKRISAAHPASLPLFPKEMLDRSEWHPASIPSPGELSIESQLDINPTSIITKRTWVSSPIINNYLNKKFGKSLSRFPAILQDPKISVRLSLLEGQEMQKQKLIPPFLEGYYPRLKTLVVRWEERFNQLPDFGSLREITVYNSMRTDINDVSVISDEFIAKVNKKNISIRWLERGKTVINDYYEVRSPSTETLKKLSQITHLNHLSFENWNRERITAEPFDQVKNLTQLESLDFEGFKFTKDLLNFLPSLINLKALSLFGCSHTDLIIQQLPQFKKLTDLVIYDDKEKNFSIENCVALQRLNLKKSRLYFSVEQIKDVLNAGEFQKINFMKLTISFRSEYDLFLFPTILSILDCPTIKNLCVDHVRVPKSKSEGLLEKINEAIVHQLFDNFKLFSFESNWEMTSHTFTLFE